MDDDSSALSLSLPMRSGQAKLDLRPRAIRRWTRGLPLANLGWTSGSLYETLKLANASPLTADRRVELLELLRPTFCYAIQRLRKHYTFHEYPVPARSQEVRRFVSALLGEVVAGYRLIIDDLAASSGRLSKPRLALALQRAMRCVSGQLIESFRLYEEPPAGIWQCLHELYRLARAHGVEHLRVRDDGLTSRGRCSVGLAYKQVLLLAAMEPGQLRQQELDGLFAALKSVAAVTELQAAESAQERTHAYLVRLDADKGPIRHPGPAPTADAVWLDCGRFVALGALPARPQPGWRPARHPRRPVSPQLLTRIRRALARSPQPRSRRTRSDERLQAVFGLGRISRMLAEIQPEAEDSPQTMAAETEDGEWMFDEASGHWRRGSAAPEPAAEESEDEPADPLRDLARQMQVVDTSTRGYALRLDDDRPQAVRVGEAIALRRSAAGGDDPTGWQIGFIQWMQREPEALRLGVELLAFRPAPILLRPRSAPADEKPVHGLMLPAVPALKRPSSLLAPHLNLAPGDELIVSEGETETAILLTVELARTGSCQHFDYAPSYDDEQAAAPEEAPATDFRALYATI